MVKTFCSSSFSMNDLQDFFSTEFLSLSKESEAQGASGAPGADQYTLGMFLVALFSFIQPVPRELRHLGYI